jgi:hypothetical protein
MGDILLARDHSVEWVWASFELVLGQPQPFEGVEVSKVEATAPSMRALVSRAILTSRSTIMGNLPSFGILSG